MDEEGKRNWGRLTALVITVLRLTRAYEWHGFHDYYEKKTFLLPYFQALVQNRTCGGNQWRVTIASYAVDLRARHAMLDEMARRPSLAVHFGRDPLRLMRQVADQKTLHQRKR